MHSSDLIQVKPKQNVQVIEINYPDIKHRTPLQAIDYDEAFGVNQNVLAQLIHSDFSYTNEAIPVIEFSTLIPLRLIAR